MSEHAERAARYRVIGMDCASDAAAVEKAVRRVPAGASARVSVASHLLSAASMDPDSFRQVEQAVGDLGFRLEPVQEQPGGDTHQRPGYRRALWIVVVLNLGYGVIEAIGGFLAQSQALKADSLDFLADGAITMLGLIAIGWSARWRARSALIQGLFLGGLGLAVIGSVIYRTLVQELPDAQTMGVLAGIALLVNFAAAALLLPFRSGDTNVRAVWLYSRNDAIGNAMVLGAAGVIAVSGSAWPDLVAAILVAGLFLLSSWSIVRSALHDLRETGLTT